MNLLKGTDITVEIRGKTVVDHVSFSLDDGEWLMIAGPNGAGKTTLVNAVTGGREHTGTVLYRGDDIRRLSAKQRAREIGVLSQTHHIDYAFRVHEVVRLGRYAYRGSFLSGGADKDGAEMVEHALALTGLTEKASQSVLTLSGGEMQRMFLAQLFAQDPKVLILDEPMNHLDLVYQKQLLSIIQEWLREEGRAVISVMHDLSIARAFGTAVMLLRDGKCMAQGTVEEAFRADILQKTYDTDVHDWMRQMLAQWKE